VRQAIGALPTAFVPRDSVNRKIKFLTNSDRCFLVSANPLATKTRPPIAVELSKRWAIADEAIVCSIASGSATGSYVRSRASVLPGQNASRGRASSSPRTRRACAEVDLITSPSCESIWYASHTAAERFRHRVLASRPRRGRHPIIALRFDAPRQNPPPIRDRCSPSRPSLGIFPPSEFRRVSTIPRP